MPEPATHADLQPSMPDDAFFDARPSQSQVRGSSESRVLVVRRRVVLVRLVRNRPSKPEPRRSRKSPSSIPSPSSSSATASLPPFMPMSPTFAAAWHVSRPSSAIVNLETSMQTANDPQRTYEAEIWKAAKRSASSNHFQEPKTPLPATPAPLIDRTATNRDCAAACATILPPMPSVVLQQVSSDFACKNARATLHKRIGIKTIARHLEPALVDSLNQIAPDGLIHVWGAKLERSHQFEEVFPRGSIVLFRRGKYIFAHGAIAETTFNPVLAEKMWGRDSDGQTWPLIFFLKRLVPFEPKREAAKFNEVILHHNPNDNWQGMTALALEDSPKLQAYFANQLDNDV